MHLMALFLCRFIKLVGQVNKKYFIKYLTKPTYCGMLYTYYEKRKEETQIERIQQIP